MRRANVMATALAVAFVAAGTWGYVHLRGSGRAGTRVAARAVDFAVPAAPVEPAADDRFTVPEEPAPPEAGSPARQPYFRAMVAGDERALALARKALAEAGRDPGGVSPGYVERLKTMQSIYEERLARHRDALAH
jgi:hypothetical protein